MQRKTEVRSAAIRRLKLTPFCLAAAVPGMKVGPPSPVDPGRRVAATATGGAAAAPVTGSDGPGPVLGDVPGVAG